MLNAPGLVDSGYRGEIKIIAVNLDPTTPVAIKRGDRIAQMVTLKVERAELEVVDTLPNRSAARVVTAVRLVNPVRDVRRDTKR